MTTLDFDYDSRTGDSFAEYRGLRIKAVRDESPRNPWEDWDGNAPLIVNYDGRLTAYDKDAGVDLLRPFSSATISDSMLRRHMGAICKALDSDFRVTDTFGTQSQGFTAWLQQEARDNHARYGGSLTDIKRDILEDSLDGMRESDKLDALAAIYNAIGWQAATAVSRGYCQGDYAELLFVATPHFAKKTGCIGKKYDSAFWARDFDGAEKLYSAWARGDVYGFVIESPDGEHLDSCWGYYGDFDESGLSEAAIESADHILAAAKTRRLQAVKRCVVNRVPLNHRPAIIDAAAQLESA